MNGLCVLVCNYNSFVPELFFLFEQRIKIAMDNSLVWIDKEYESNLTLRELFGSKVNFWCVECEIYEIKWNMIEL